MGILLAPGGTSICPYGHLPGSRRNVHLSIWASSWPQTERPFVFMGRLLAPDGTSICPYGQVTCSRWNVHLSLRAGYWLRSRWNVCLSLWTPYWLQTEHPFVLMDTLLAPDRTSICHYGHPIDSRQNVHLSLRTLYWLQTERPFVIMDTLLAPDRKSQLKQNTSCVKSPMSRITFSFSGLHDMTISIIEINTVRVQLPEW